MAEVIVTGLDDLQRKLKLLPERIGKNAMRRALRKGANVIRDQARNNAKQFDDPQTRESIVKNITVASGGRKRERREGGVMMRVGVMGGARAGRGNSGNPGGDTWYFRLLEFGTSQMAAQPFLRPAMYSSAAAALQKTADAMTVEFNKEINKLGAK